MGIVGINTKDFLLESVYSLTASVKVLSRIFPQNVEESEDNPGWVVVYRKVWNYMVVGTLELNRIIKIYIFLNKQKIN